MLGDLLWRQCASVEKEAHGTEKIPSVSWGPQVSLERPGLEHPSSTRDLPRILARLPRREDPPIIVKIRVLRLTGRAMQAFQDKASLGRVGGP